MKSRSNRFAATCTGGDLSLLWGYSLARSRARAPAFIFQTKYSSGSFS